jgi:hypothetical protein
MMRSYNVPVLMRSSPYRMFESLSLRQFCNYPCSLGWSDPPRKGLCRRFSRSYLSTADPTNGAPAFSLQPSFSEPVYYGFLVHRFPSGAAQRFHQGDEGGCFEVAIAQARSPDAIAAPSQARWCLNGGSQNVTSGECVYRTLDQCVQDRIGEGGHCDPNPNGPPADR